MLCRPGRSPTKTVTWNQTSCTILHEVRSLSCHQVCREAATYLAGFSEEAIQVLEHGRAIVPIDACHHLILIVVKVTFSFQLCISRGVTVCLRGVAG